MKFIIKQPNPALRFTQTPQRRTRTTRIIYHHYHHERATPQDVHRWHLNNGWIGFGYNFAVDMDGTIWEGRGLDTVGTHTGNNNGDSIGIAVQGRYDDHTQQMPDAQFNALVWLTKHIQGVYGNIPMLRHRDVTATACPGRHFPWNELQRLKYRGEVVEPPAPPRIVTLDILGRVEEIGGYIDNGATWVRLTEFGAALGFDVSWDNERRIPVIAAEYEQPHITPANQTEPQGKAVALDILGNVQNISGYIDNGATWVRLTEFAAALGFAAIWDDKRRIPAIIPAREAGGCNLLTCVSDIRQADAQADIQLLKQIVHFEARGEGRKGQIMVANVIHNRIKSPRFPNSLREVILQPNAFTPTQRPDFGTATPSAQTAAAVMEALSGVDLSNGAEFFHAISHLTPEVFHERAVADGRLVITHEYRNHRFYKHA